MTAPGLLIDGALVDVPGVTVIPPADHDGPTWNQLHSDDYTARRVPPSIVCIHSTGGRWPQPVIEAAARGGHAREVIEMWSGQDRGGGERVHSAAPLVVDFDGVNDLPQERRVRVSLRRVHDEQFSVVRRARPDCDGILRGKSAEKRNAP